MQITTKIKIKIKHQIDFLSQHKVFCVITQFPEQIQLFYHSSYETLLHKSGKTTVNVRNLRNLCKEIFKSLNNLNPVFLKEIFYFKESNRPVREKYKLIPQILKINQVKFGTKSLRGLGPKIWNTLSYHIKTSENIDIFKKALLKNWNGVECKCLVCQKSA